MAEWFSKAVLKNLLETFRGNPDKDWWSRIVTSQRFGSGGQTELTGWFVRDFLGLRDGDFKQSGVNVVPITITNGVTEEEAALVAGYAITEGEVTDGNVAFPAVQSVLGWGLLMDPNSKFN